jgi:hypothetical protein
VYTETQDLLFPYKDKLGDKLVIKNYIPRIELLKELSSMDFLVNISYDPVHQAPSKLIDYYLTGRPIVSSLTSEFNNEIVAAFLKGDYSQTSVFDNIEKFKIENKKLNHFCQFTIKYFFKVFDVLRCSIIAVAKAFHCFDEILLKGILPLSNKAFSSGYSNTNCANSVLNMSIFGAITAPGFALIIVVKIGNNGVLSSGVFDSFLFTGIFNASKACK